MTKEQKIIEVNGAQGGSIIYDGKKVIIKRKGFLSFAAHGVKGDKIIPLKFITAIQFKDAGFGTGYIQFSIMGGREAKGGLFQGIYDENTILFNKKQQPEFEKLKEMIEEEIYK